jgi:hypothetical protein
MPIISSRLKSSCDSEDSDANTLFSKVPRITRPLVLLVEAEIDSKILHKYYILYRSLEVDFNISLFAVHGVKRSIDFFLFTMWKQAKSLMIIS